MPAESLKHPGVAVRRLLDETGLSVTGAAEQLEVSRSQLQRLLGKQSGISPEMALRLSTVFGIDARECLDRQTAYDLARARRKSAREIQKLKPFTGPLRHHNKAYVIDKLRRHKLELRRLGLRHLFLFGSVARGDATLRSDIDLYYEAEPGHSMGLIELGTIEQRLSVLLDAPVDLVPGDSLKPHIRKSVRKDQISVF